MPSVNKRVDTNPAFGNNQFMPFFVVYSLLIHRSSGKIVLIPSTEKQVWDTEGVVLGLYEYFLSSFGRITKQVKLREIQLVPRLTYERRTAVYNVKEDPTVYLAFFNSVSLNKIGN